MKKTLLTILLFGAFYYVGLAQSNFEKDKLDSYFDVIEESNRFMGSVAISKNGELIYTRSVGFSDVENNIKSNSNTKYRIGSISKTFTAVLALKAFEDNKLDLNQTIDKWFPTIKKANKITVSQLLNHRSGIHNFTNDRDYMTWNTQSKSEKEMIEIISKRGLDFKPNSKANYSNSNYVLLSYILEKTFSKSYSDLLQEYIAKPIGLTNTKVFDKINSNDNIAKSYQFKGSWRLENETDFSIPLGAGAIESTPSDLVKFSDALFGGKLVSNESLSIMKTIKDGYGSGLFSFPFYQYIAFGHTGGIDGFTSEFTHFSDDKISYSLVCNGTNMNNNDVSIAVLSAAFNRPYVIPVFSTYTVTFEELEQYLGTYSSKDIPLKLTISKDDITLIAQAKGQSAFPLDPVEKDKFKFDQAGVEIEFNPSNKTLILKQGGGSYTFTKE